MKTSLNSILSLHRENFGWIAPWMLRAPQWNKIISPQSPLTATPSSLSTAIYHCCPFPFFQRRCHCCHCCHGRFFSLFLATHAAERSLFPDNQCPRLQRPSRLKTGGLPLPPGGSATNDAMSIPTTPTCFRSRGGTLIIGRTAIPWQLLSLLLLPLSPLLLPSSLSLPSPLLLPLPSPLLQVAVILAKTINLSRFLICPMFFCTWKQVAVTNAYTTGQKLMGLANQRLGKLLLGLPEDLRFCGCFGMLAEVSVAAWDSMMENHSVLPPTPKFLHFYGRLHSCAHIPQMTPLCQVC